MSRPAAFERNSLPIVGCGYVVKSLEAALYARKGYRPGPLAQ